MGTLPKTVEGVQGPPDYDDVQGFEEQETLRIPVEVNEPLTVRQLPAVDGQTRTVLISLTGDGMKLLNKNPLRGRTTLVSDGDYYLGFSRNEAEAGFGHIPAGQALVLTSGAQLWVAARNASTGTYVTAIEEFWTN